MSKYQEIKEKVQIQIMKHGLLLSKLDDMSEKVQKEIIAHKPDAIRFIKDPGKDLQLLSFNTAHNTRNMDLIEDVLYNIENPHRELQQIVIATGVTPLYELLKRVDFDIKLIMEGERTFREQTILRNPYAIKIFNEIEDDLAILAIKSVRSNGRNAEQEETEREVIKHILSKEPSAIVQMEIIQQRPYIWIDEIKNPCVEVQNYILDYDFSLYAKLKNVDEEVIARGIREYNVFPYENNEPPVSDWDGTNLDYYKDLVEFCKDYKDHQTKIINQSDKIKNAAIDQDPFYIEYIKEPNVELQLKAVKINPECIKCIKKPHDIIQKEVLRQNPFNVLWIDRLSDMNAKYVLKKLGFPEDKIKTLKAIPAVAKLFASELRKVDIPKEQIIESLINQFNLQQMEKKSEINIKVKQ
ncbi:MAG: hypothetical protein ACRC26_02250 [Bacteroidales bacterium]